jgi:SAM-dependent methyltransferase
MRAGPAAWPHHPTLLFCEAIIERGTVSVRRPSGTPGESWAGRASIAIRAGDLFTAEQCLREAVRTDKRSARYRLHWATVLEQLSDYATAVEQLTEALHLAPNMSAAAGQLSSLLNRHPPPPHAKCNPSGLRAALNHDNVSSDLITDLALTYLIAKGPLRQSFEAAHREGWHKAARDLSLRKTAAPLKDALFLAILRRSALRHPQLERLLTALRAVLLLEVRPQRFEDPALRRFAIALMQQCRANEYVWPVGPEEEAVVGQPFTLSEPLAGDPTAGRKLLLLSLYKSLAETLGDGIDRHVVSTIRPRDVGEAVQALLAEDDDLRRRAAQVPSLGSVADATSREVAQQYERSPYPRWTSVHVPAHDEMRKRFGEFFKPRQLAFMDRPFEMLVAGCGTGRQAVVAALGLANAHVTAIDLSASSLAYASKMAERLGAKNITFAKADILSLHTHAPHFLSRFQVIACVGVLHHLADPFEGWRRLLDCLAPGGLMLVGLYSAVARRHLAALRSDPAYPGAGCPDAALRTFRRLLMDRAKGTPGSALVQSPDFYTASEFRDLVCHVNEQHLTLPDIKEFLDRNALTFRGFWLDPQHLHEFRKRYPSEPWPGCLECWETYEQANPRTFDAMYLFWCDKA